MIKVVLNWLECRQALWFGLVWPSEAGSHRVIGTSIHAEQVLRHWEIHWFLWINDLVSAVEPANCPPWSFFSVWLEAAFPRLPPSQYNHMNQRWSVGPKRNWYVQRPDCSFEKKASWPPLSFFLLLAGWEIGNAWDQQLPGTRKRTAERATQSCSSGLLILGHVREYQGNCFI